MDNVVNFDLCINCQKIKSVKLSSTQEGREKIIEAAAIRQDDVYLRLQALDNKDAFSYHPECKKSYTHRKTLNNINKRDEPIAILDNSEEVYVQKKPLGDVENQDDVSVRIPENLKRKNIELPFVRRSRRIKLDSSNQSLKCFICGCCKKNCDNELHELHDPDIIKSVFKASRDFQDIAFENTANLISEESFLSAKLLYHKNCLVTYQYKIVAHFSNSTEKRNVKTHVEELADSLIDPIYDNAAVNSSQAITDVIKSIEAKFLLGKIFSFEEISKVLKQKYDISLKAAKLKSALIDYFGQNINFVAPTDKKNSTLFYSNKIDKVIENSYYHDCTVVCASELRKSLIEKDFKLDNSFCDEVDVRASWDNFNLPETFQKFFSKLFNIDVKELLEAARKPTWEDLLDNFDEGVSRSKDFFKLSKIKSLYQIIHNINNSRKKNPQHILLGIFVYSTTKSKNVIDILNRLGLSISYDEILRIRTRLASYVVNSSIDDVPIPSNFNLNNFVTGAFDNFDFNESTISGLDSSHDTVIVLFQDENVNFQNEKPHLTESGIDTRPRTFNSLLKCQEILEYQKSKVAILPENYTVSPETRALSLQDYENNLSNADLLWYLSRMDFSNNTISEKITHQHVPAWSAFNSYVHEDNRNKQKVGYFPVIPSPVTDRRTVYTCLKIFVKIADQLNQEHLPIFCDEGVYRIARPILFENEKEFEKIILCLGSFHMIKVVETCIGKYMKHSGIENIFIETNLFGVCVTEQLMNGNNYDRCLKAYSYVAEALRRMQLKKFFTVEKLNKYKNVIEDIILLQESFECKNNGECKHIFGELQTISKDLQKDFNEFVLTRCEESELFKYYNNLLILVNLLLNLIRADRTGDWILHIKTVEELQPLFHVFDRINYLRWCSMYLQDMLSLKEKAPGVFNEFLNGRFTVKRSNVSFTSVATDQALEQTINRTSKSSGGVIGSTRKKAAVAAWDLTFHEFLALNNFFKEILNFQNIDEGVFIHHEFNGSTTINSESAVQKILDYLYSKNANPFQEGKQPLRNIVTGELTHESVRSDILNMLDKGIKLYSNFFDERFVKKIKTLSETVRRNNLPDLKSIPNTEKSGKKLKTHTVSETQRIVALANARNFSLEKLLCYDLTYKNILFDDDGLFRKEAEKYKLTQELEKIENYSTEEFVNCDINTCLIIDVMLLMRGIKWKSNATFRDLAIKFCYCVSYKAFTQKTSRIDFVFDSYFNNSLKSSEHQRRCSGECIVFHEINAATKLPKQEDKFWGSSENKIKLQQFLRDYILKERSFNNYDIVFSTINDEPSTSNRIALINIELQRNEIEEADVKIMIHIKHAIQKGYKNIYLISSDTDVIVLALYFFETFKSHGLQTLWVEGGSGQTRRNIAIHTLANLHGRDLCNVLPALHHLTGADYTSKVGTKPKALQENPAHYLQNFGKNCFESEMEKCISEAEQYLVNVVNRYANCKSFDELRFWTYHHSTQSLIEQLPPTSQSITLHILRAFYVVYMQTSCLSSDMTNLDPTSYGFVLDNDLLLPQKVEILIPPADELVPACSCKVCSRNSCICRRMGIPCCEFCACKKHDTCKNIYN